MTRCVKHDYTETRLKCKMETNTIVHGDCIEEMQSMDDNSVDLIVTDPPYNINKAEWDNIDEYFEWLDAVFQECERLLKSNGTLWFFHMNFRSLSEIHHRITENTEFVHKQLITIDKGLQSIAGRTSEDIRSFPTATEYIQFYTFPDLTESAWLEKDEGTKHPMAEYLRNEFDRADANHREIAELFPSKNGNITGCVHNWVTGKNFPLERQYQKIREYLNENYPGRYLKREYEELKREYEELKREYEERRYTFNLPPRVTDVWEADFYEQDINHPTAKPVKIVRRIIKAASNKGDVVLDPFLGSGTTAVACNQKDRDYIGIERNQEYVQLANKRINNQPQRISAFC